MKEIFLLLLCSLGAGLAARQCCEKNVIGPRGVCVDNLVRINLNCTLGHMLLRDIVLSGEKLSTRDTPNYFFAENSKEYCLGTMLRNTSDPASDYIPVAVLCFQEKFTAPVDLETTGILSLISVVFLLLTFAVYMFLPQMRDLQGLCYMCMCLSMALGLLSLGILQLSTNFVGNLCTMTGFLVYFWMIATFFWMNVICINMYRSVSNASYLKRTSMKQYFWYSCYAWGCTFVMLLVTLITNFAEGDHWKPNIGQGSCWFNGRTETWIFFYGPVAVLIGINIILFILSSIALWNNSVRYEVNILNNLKYKFLLSLKLFLVMGISWIFEIASFAHGESHIIWKITDTFNCLQGVVIFILLVVLRKRSIQALAKLACCKCLTPLAGKLNPHDYSDDENIITDDNTEVRLN